MTATFVREHYPGDHSRSIDSETTEVGVVWIFLKL